MLETESSYRPDKLAVFVGKCGMSELWSEACHSESLTRHAGVRLSSVCMSMRLFQEAAPREPGPRLVSGAAPNFFRGVDYCKACEWKKCWGVLFRLGLQQFKRFDFKSAAQSSVGYGMVWVMHGKWL